MCKYCETGESLFYKEGDPIQEVYIEKDNTISITHPLSEFSVNVEINYCPMCGKELNKR